MKAAIYNRSCWIYEVSDTNFTSALDHILLESGFEILNEVEHFFLPVGYTKIWLLGESHCAIHTFPEEHVVYLELSSCILEKALAFWEILQQRSSQLGKKINLPPLNTLIATK